MKTGELKFVAAVVFLLIFAGAIFGVLRWMTATTTLYVATHDIQPHQVITAEDLSPVKVHKTVADLPANYVTDLAEVEGTHARTIILANQLVSRDMIAEFAEEELSVLALAENERLGVISFSPQTTSGVTMPAFVFAEMLQPGDTVSFIAVTQDGRAKVFAQGVTVLGVAISGAPAAATGQEGAEAPENALGGEVILMFKATPELLEQVAAAEAGGAVLVAIDPYEFKVVSTQGADLDTLVSPSGKGVIRYEY